jgi:heme exporter protein B
LQGNSAGWAGRAFAVYVKDVRTELRSRYGVNAVLMFGVTTLAVVSFSLGQSSLSAPVLAALFWIIVFFSATAGLSMAFVREEEAGTALALRLTADPTAVYLGKLLFNFTLLIVLAVVITPLFFLFTDAGTANLYLFFLVELLGLIGLCAASTLVAAIISRAAVRGPLFAVLSFPIMITLLMLLVTAAARLMDGGGLADIWPALQGLIAYAVVMITASLMLFRSVWMP